MRLATCAVILPLLALAPAVTAQASQPDIELVESTIPGPVEVPYTPPACVGIFPDVPCSNQFSTWIEQLYRDRITTGCGGGNYCPDSFVTRGQMSAFLERMARGTDHWPANVAYVHHVTQANGTPDDAASGQALRNAIAAIPTSGPRAPSATQRYVVMIGPGRFNVGSGRLDVPDSVDLYGSGREATEVYLVDERVLFLGNSRVSDMQFTRPGGSSNYALQANGNLWLDRVKVSASDGTTWTIAVVVGTGTLHATHSFLYAYSTSGTALGVYVDPVANNVVIRDCDVYGASPGGASIRHNGTSTVHVFSTLLGQALQKTNTGGFLCAYNANAGTYAPFACP